MRPSEVVLTPRTPQDSPRTSSDFEEVHYPGNNWASSRAPEELPLHYMNEDKDKARRRVTHPAVQPGQERENVEFDTEGKDVYAKMKQSHGGIGGGRPRRAPPLPPTSIVRICDCYPVLSLTSTSDGIPFSKPGAHSSSVLHTPFMLDSFSQNRDVEPSRLGRSAFWQVWLSLFETRVLL